MLLAGIALAVFLLLLFLGIPFGFALGLAGLGGIVYVLGWETGIQFIADYPMRFITPYIFGAVALFILMGYLATAARVTDDLFEVAYKWAGRLPGGLASAAVAACTMFGAVTGLNVAAVAALGKTTITEMRKRDYYPPMAAACVAASSNQGTLIPPSLNAIFYGMLMQVSIGRQIMAGLIPGLVTAALYIVLVMTRARISPSLAPPAKGVPWKEAVSSLPKLWSVIVLFGLVVGGIYTGIFTPTEAAAIGCALALVMCLARNGLQWQPIKTALIESSNLCGMVFFLLLGAGVMKFFFSISGVSEALAMFFGGLDIPVWALTLLLLLPFLILGMFIETITIQVLLLPVYYSIMTQVGIDLMVFGVLVVKLCNIAFLTPPFGFNVIFTHGIVPDIPLWDTYKEALWFIMVDIIVVVLIVALPAIVTLIPDMM